MLVAHSKILLVTTKNKIKKWTLRLRQKVKRDKLSALYRHLNVTGNPDLIDLDRFRLTKDPKKGVTIFECYNVDT